MFFSTFALIFLAELGDKTQLTALARSATGNRWIVFAAASLALACSTLVAVLFGTVIRRYIPEQYIKIAAGVLFLVFGTFTLISALPSKEKAPVPVVEEGLPAPWVLRLAAGFEEAAAKDYRNLAQKATGRLKNLFECLAAEEEEHLSQLNKGDWDRKSWCDFDEYPHLFHDVSSDEAPLLAHAMEHEQATADFYRALAKKVHLPGLKKQFHRLAEEELSHLQRLRNIG